MSYIKFESRTMAVKVDRLRHIGANAMAYFSRSRFNVHEFFPHHSSKEEFVVNINDCIHNGDNLLKFFAFIHAMSETHGVIAVESFKEIVVILEEFKITYQDYGLNEQIDELINLFKRARSPIVLSFSVTDSFRNYRNNIKKITEGYYYHNIVEGGFYSFLTINDYGTPKDNL